MPPVVEWAQKSLWGNDNQNWTIKEHYHELSPENNAPSHVYRVVEHSITVQSQKIDFTEVELKVYLPKITHISSENFKISIDGWGREIKDENSTLRDLRPVCSHDLYSDVVTCSNFEFDSNTNMGVLTLYLQTYWLQQLSVSQTRLSTSVLSDEHWLNFKSNYQIHGYYGNNPSVIIEQISFDNEFSRRNFVMKSWS